MRVAERQDESLAPVPGTEWCFGCGPENPLGLHPRFRAEGTMLVGEFRGRREHQGFGGLVQGGVQSLSRSLFGRLVPPGKAGEFFGFYNLMGKAAAILGPTLTGVVALMTNDSRLAILSIVILFVIGALFLMKVPVSVAQRPAQNG